MTEKRALMEMIKIIQDLRLEFKKGMETLKRVQDEMTTKLENPINI